MVKNSGNSLLPQYETIREFFEKVPPGKEVEVKRLCPNTLPPKAMGEIEITPIELHCDDEACGRKRFFYPQGGARNAMRSQPLFHFLTFTCKNCERTSKTYAFSAILSMDGGNGHLFKFGEHPSFGPPTPARVITLIGPDRDYYLKGRRAENQALGIAAFAYYRRVIENQKNRIFDEIIRVSEKLNAAAEVINDLKAAKNETQFSKAVEVIKHGIPQTLMINGQNPISLLHSALSEGLHAQTDEECLELATSIRVVLTELVERMATALKDEVELNAAVSRLLQKKAPKPES